MTEQPYRTVDKFDRLMGALIDLPDVTKTKPSTITVVSPLIGEAQTFVIQTLRQKEVGDFVFLQYAASEGLTRIAIPPAAVDAIVRQRDSLTVKVRKRIGKQQAADRKARGELPGFMRVKKKKKSPPKGRASNESS